MTLEKSFQNLAVKLQGLLETVEQRLQWAITEGQPLGTVKGARVEVDHILVTRCDDAALELASLVTEAIVAAEAGRQAVAPNIDLFAARGALITCQERVNHLSEKFFAEMVSFEALDDLHSLAREHNKWQQWVSGVKDALQHCRQPIADVNQVLFELWQEITEHRGLSSLSVQAISTGQKINFAAEKASQT